MDIAVTHSWTSQDLKILLGIELYLVSNLTRFVFSSSFGHCRFAAEAVLATAWSAIYGHNRLSTAPAHRVKFVRCTCGSFSNLCLCFMPCLSFSVCCQSAKLSLIQSTSIELSHSGELSTQLS